MKHDAADDQRTYPRLAFVTQAVQDHRRRSQNRCVPVGKPWKHPNQLDLLLFNCRRHVDGQWIRWWADSVQPCKAEEESHCLYNETAAPLH